MSCFDEYENPQVLQTKRELDNCKENHFCSLTQAHNYLFFAKELCQANHI